MKRTNRESATAPEVELLRTAYQEGLDDIAASGCSTDEQLTALALGEIRGTDRELMADHIVSCRACAESYRLLRELHRETLDPAKGRSAGWGRQLVALAATAVIVMGGLYVVWNAPEPPDPEVVRGPGSSDVRPAPGATLAAAPPELVWPDQVGSEGYRVRLFDSEGQLLWQSESVRAAGVAIPTDIPWASGSSYYWTVDIAGPVARSRLGPFGFRLQE